MLQARVRLRLAALVAGLAGACGALGSQASTLDVSKLGPQEGYVVGTIQLARTHDDGGLVTLDEHPDVTADLDVCERREAGTLNNALTLEGSIEQPKVWAVIVHGHDGPALLALKLPARRCCFDALRIEQADGEWSQPIGWCFDVVPGAVTYVGDLQLRLSGEGSSQAFTRWKALDWAVGADWPLLDALLRKRFPDAHPQLLDGVTGNSGD